MKTILRSMLSASGLVGAWLRMRRRSYFLMLHGVGVDNYTSESFERLARHLRRTFRVVGMAEAISSPAAAGKPLVTLTFDDGLRNNVACAYPVLKQFGLPATYFVCPGAIDAGGWLWTHEMRARLAGLDSAQVMRVAKSLGMPEAGSSSQFVEAVKKADPNLRAEAIETVRRNTREFSPSSRQCRAYDLADWAELKSMDPTLVTIGSHSWSHEILRGLAAESLRVEVEQSRRRIESVLGRPAEYFCYPNGDYDGETLAAVQTTYVAAVATRSASVGNSDRKLHELPRIAVDEDLPALMLRLARY